MKEILETMPRIELALIIIGVAVLITGPPVLYASGAFTIFSRENNKGLYATMKRWRIDP